MAYELRKYGIILAVAVLFAIFAFAFAQAFIQPFTYPEECTEKNPPVHRQQIECEEIPPVNESSCPGTLQPNYFTCTYDCTCFSLEQDYRAEQEAIIFWIALILSAIAITVGLLLPQNNPVHEWVGTGFILGGILTLFIATGRYWSEMHQIVRPVVIALELALILWISYKKMLPNKKKK